MSLPTFKTLSNSKPYQAYFLPMKMKYIHKLDEKMKISYFFTKQEHT